MAIPSGQIEITSSVKLHIGLHCNHSGYLYIFKRKLKVPFVSLPNLLAGHKVVEELLQDQVQPQLIAYHLTALLFDSNVAKHQSEAFSAIHQQLACRANTSAATAVLEVIEEYGMSAATGDEQ